MSRLYIAEKPEVARAIAAALGVDIERRNGYFRCGNGDNITCLVRSGRLRQQIRQLEV